MKPVTAILRKELREQYLTSGRPRTGVIAMTILQTVGAILLGLFGHALVDLRGSMGAILATAPLLVGFIVFTSVASPLPVVVDAIAGERERHTLETLLASPAPDRAILIGKAGSILLLAALQATFFALASAISMTVALGATGALFFFPIVAAAPLVAALAASYSTGLGVLISQRSPTVKQGQQTLAFAMIPFYFMPAFIGPLTTALRVQNPGLLVWILAGFGVLFVLLDVLWWVLVFALFSRKRLMAKSA